jgi:hypothetical protein
MLNDTIVDAPSITFMSHCPECNRARPVSLKRIGLLEKLADDEDVEVLNGVCGHAYERERRLAERSAPMFQLGLQFWKNNL